MKTEHGYEIVGDDYGRPPGFEGHGTGYQPRDYASFPLNGHSFARAATVTRLSEKEIIEAITEKTAKKSWASDIADRVGSKVKDQGQSSYCWAHAPTRGMEYAHLLTGAPPLVFSAFYTAWPIKHGSNQGGSGIQAVESLVKRGTCVESLVPPQTFHVKETPEITENAALHCIVDYEEFEPGDKIGMYSSIIQNQCITVGIPAWGHEVLLSFLALVGGIDFSNIREGFDNSWKYTWGNNGRGVLDGAKRKFDEGGRIATIKQSIA